MVMLMRCKLDHTYKDVFVKIDVTLSNLRKVAASLISAFYLIMDFPGRLHRAALHHRDYCWPKRPSQ